MTDSEKDSVLIERFLDFNLSDEELTAFEERLSKDLKFENEFQTYLAAHYVVNDFSISDKEQLRKQQWNNILNKKELTQAQKNIPWHWIGGIAAGFILLFSIWKTNQIVQEPNMSVLLNQAWEKEVGLDYTSLRSLDKDSIKIQLHHSFESYQNKKYQLAIHLLSDFKRTNTALFYEDILLIRALSNYKIGNTVVALKTLDTLANYPTRKKSKVALWYQGLIHLEMGDTEAAQKFIVLPSGKSQEIKLKK